MKIRTQADIEALDTKIQNELGVDVRKYQNEEVVEKIIALLVFPEYVLTWMLGPVLLALVFFVLGFYLLHLVHVEFVLYAVFGFLLFITVGLLSGLLLLTSKMKKDIWSIADYSLSMTEAAVLDVNTVNRTASKEQKKEAYGLLFKGIIHIVTIPMTTKALAEKLPILGRILNKFVRKFFTLISDRIKFDEVQIITNKDSSQEPSKNIGRYSKSMSLASLGMGKMMGLCFGLIRLPLKIVLGVVMFMLLLFIWILN